MASKKITFVDELDASKDFVNMKVRLIRRWINPIQKLDMILIDEKAKKIQATVKKELVPQFDKQLKEDGVFLIKMLGVGVFDDPFPVIKNKVKLNFYKITEVCHDVGFDSSFYGFNFVPFTDIDLKLAKNPDILNIDVIGSVTHSGNMDCFKSPRGETKMLNLDLKDLEGTVMRCTLWNNYATEFNQFVENNKSNEHVILIIQHALVNEWKGKITVQSDKYGTRLFINEDIQHANDFRRRIIIKEGAAGNSNTTLSTQTVYPNRLEFLLNHDRKHLDEVREVEEVGEFIVPATIKLLEQELGWFFIGCRKCNRKVYSKMEYLDVAKDEEITEELIKSPVESIWCRKEKAIATQVMPMFRVTFRVQDATGSASFVMWDRDVQKIIGLTATNIRERQLKNGDGDSYPHELDGLLNKKLAFHIKIDTYNLEHKGSAYTVIKMCDDPDIIAELLAMDAVDQVRDEVNSEAVSTAKLAESSQGGVESKQRDEVNSEAVSTPKLAESSQGGVDSKDAFSVTGDSVAADLEKDAETSPLQKRAIETPGVQSTTKGMKRMHKMKIISDA